MKMGRRSNVDPVFTFLLRYRVGRILCGIYRRAHLVSRHNLRLCEGKYIKAALWSCVLAFLIHIDAN
jgi:hypothetical protein